MFGGRRDGVSERHRRHRLTKTVTKGSRHQDVAQPKGDEQREIVGGWLSERERSGLVARDHRAQCRVAFAGSKLSLFLPPIATSGQPRAQRTIINNYYETLLALYSEEIQLQTTARETNIDHHFVEQPIRRVETLRGGKRP